jgi:hypothetical protein
VGHDKERHMSLLHHPVLGVDYRPVSKRDRANMIARGWEPKPPPQPVEDNPEPANPAGSSVDATEEDDL